MTLFDFEEESSLECQWRDLETRNELMKTNAVMLKLPLISLRQALRELGYSDEEVSRILAEKESDPPVGAAPAGGGSMGAGSLVQPGLKSMGQQNQPTTQPERGSDVTP